MQIHAEGVTDLEREGRKEDEVREEDGLRATQLHV